MDEKAPKRPLEAASAARCIKFVASNTRWLTTRHRRTAGATSCISPGGKFEIASQLLAGDDRRIARQVEPEATVVSKEPEEHPRIGAQMLERIAHEEIDDAPSQEIHVARDGGHVRWRRAEAL